MKYLALLLCALVGLSACAERKVRYDNYAVYKVFIDNAIQLTIAKQLSENIHGYTIWRSFSGVGGNFDIMVSPVVVISFTALTKLYRFRTELLIPNVQKLIDDESKAVSADAAFGWDSYHSLDEIYAWLDELLAKYPGITSSFVIGKSYEGRDIRGIRISQLGMPTSVFIEGTSVASEWITASTATYIINEILTSNDWYFQSLAAKVEWYIVPVLNVDGYVYSHKYNRLWRKTRKPNIGTNCIGVDLSRNFNFKWMENQGGSGIPCSEYYAGTEAYSEPESRALTTYIRSLRGRVGLFLSFRAYGQYVLTPFAYSTVRPKNYDDLLEIAEATVYGIAAKYGAVYTAGSAAAVVGIASGNVVDWAEDQMPGRGAELTWVLRDTGKYGYVLPSVYIKTVGQETMSGLANTLKTSMDLLFIW